MGSILYIVTILLIITWAIGLIGYNAGGLINVLLILALLAIIVRIFQEKKSLTNP